MKNILLFMTLFLSTQLLSQSKSKADIINSSLYKFSGKNQFNRVVNNASLKNKISIVSFWFAACAPCITETPELISLYKKYETNKQFQLLIFTFDSKQTIQKAIAKYKMPFEFIRLTQQACDTLNFGLGYPTNFIIDPDTKIVKSFGGRQIFSEEKYFEKQVYPVIDSLFNVKLKK